MCGSPAHEAGISNCTTKTCKGLTNRSRLVCKQWSPIQSGSRPRRLDTSTQGDVEVIPKEDYGKRQTDCESHTRFEALGQTQEDHRRHGAHVQEAGSTGQVKISAKHDESEVPL
jgi:hypothetical protein